MGNGPESRPEASCSDATEEMHYSGILVLVDPGNVQSAARDLDALPGIEVHYSEPDRGRLIVVQETRTVGEQQEGLRRIQAFPWVHTAALVEHRIERMTEEEGGDPS